MKNANIHPIESFQLVTAYGNKVAIFGRGAVTTDAGKVFNMHGRLNDSPLFPSKRQAVLWLRDEVKSNNVKLNQTNGGHHAGSQKCGHGCDDREIGTVQFKERADKRTKVTIWSRGYQAA